MNRPLDTQASDTFRCDASDGSAPKPRRPTGRRPHERERRAALTFVLTFVALVLPASEANAAPAGFSFIGPSGTHQNTYHRGLSCTAAKQVLRDLRGDRAFVPQACGRDRVIDGWHLRNMIRKWTTVATRYTRGTIEIHYVRHQTYDNPSCPGIGPKDDQQDWLGE